MTPCWKCAAQIDPKDGVCRYCGAGQGANFPWAYKPGWIAVLTLTALGPFALPLVWRTPRLSKNGKLVGIALVLLYSFWLAYIVRQWMAAAQSMMDQQLEGSGLSPTDLKSFGLTR